VIGAIATARTFLSNFSVPCLYVALAASLLVAGPTACVTKKLTEGRALKAEKALAQYQGQVATQTATAVQTALDQQNVAWREQQARQNAIDAALRAGDEALVQQMEGLRVDIKKQLQRSLAAPEWACLQRPLPDDVSGLFERPAG
jgi:hypothetical protein